MNGGAGLCLSGNVEQIVACRSDGPQSIVIHFDRDREIGVLLQQLATVQPVEHIVGDAEHPPRQPVLEIQHIESRDALYACPVLLVVGRNLFIPEYAELFDLRETGLQQLPQLFGRIFAHMPRIARERHGGVGRCNDEAASGPQYAGDLPDKLRVATDVLDHLERDDAVERGIGVGERGHCGLTEGYVPGPEERFVRPVLVDGGEMCGPGGDDLDAVSRSGSNLEHLARNAPCRLVVGEQRTLEDEVVGGLDRDPFGRLNPTHGCGV